MLNKTVPNNIIPKPTRYIEALSIFANTEAENPIPEKNTISTAAKIPRIAT